LSPSVPFARSPPPALAWTSLLHWREYQALQTCPESARPKLKEALRLAQRGHSLWLSAPQIAADYDEYRSCCGSMHRPRLLAQLSAMSSVARPAHSSHSVHHMLASRVQKRAAYASKKEFTEGVCRELESSVLLPADEHESACAQVHWDGGTVCHSCYRAVLGIGRSSLFKAKTRVDMAAHVRLLEQAQRDAQSSGHAQRDEYPRLIALAKQHTHVPVYRTRADPKTLLVKALLLAYCREHGQHDPAAAGSKSVARTTYVLPQHGMTELHHALCNDLEQRIARRRQLECDDPDVKLPEPPADEAAAQQQFSEHAKLLSKSTLQRVIAHLKNKCHVRIQLAKQKGVCRCTHCDELQAAIKKAPAKSIEKHMLQSLLTSHLHTASEQRRLFDTYKRDAMSNPLDLWTMTFDGFDKSKTALPHRPRLSKEQAAHMKSRIGVHVVGVMTFGAPVPVMAFFNDESVAGGANLAATIVYETLEKQWLHLVNEFRAQWARIARKPVDLQAQMSEEERAGAHAYAASRWPRRLHLTFDNTSGEAKNTTFFKAMAALVHYGVFEAITMSQLLVGHTHDIVDQMFR